jgi:hypothetical protein
MGVAMCDEGDVYLDDNNEYRCLKCHKVIEVEE